MGRVLAVDWGGRRVGLALSDEGRSLARTLPTLEGGEPLPRLLGLIREEGVDTVLVGHPVHMDGRPSPSAKQAEALAESLRSSGEDIRVVLWDERLTSRRAQDLLKERGERVGPGSKGRVDQVAAALMLQEFLDGGGA